jgi:UDP-N-acetylmuramoyl-tripeptide--D-alanyl-D-alanine ligase
VPWSDRSERRESLVESAEGLSLEQVISFTGGRAVLGGPGASFARVITDSRQAQPGDLFVALIGERFDGHRFVGQALAKGAAGVLAQEPLEKDLPAQTSFVVVQVPDTLKALGDLAAGHRKRFSVPVGALTGSNGKTTTKEMTVAVLRLGFHCLWTPGNLNNRIGLPLTLLNLDATHERVVLEMGMNEPGEIRELTRISRPEAGALLNIGPAHLGMFPSMEAVTRAKGEILEALSPDSVFVFNRDDPRVLSLSRNWKGPLRSYGLADGCDVTVKSLAEAGLRQNVRLVLQGEEIDTELRLPGRHNLYNALAAAALSSALGASCEAVGQGLASFRGVPGRFVIQEGRTFTVVDDSYNANPRSMQASLETFGAISADARRILVLGDMLELGTFSETEHEELGRRAARLDPALLCVTGTFAEAVARGASAGGVSSGKILLFEDPGALAERVLVSLEGGEWILVKGSRGMALERVVQLLEASDGF